MPQNTCTFTEFCAVWVIGLFLCTYFVVRQIRTLHALCVKTFLQWRSPSNHPPPNPKILAPRLNSAPMVALVSMMASILSALAESVLLGPGKKVLAFGRLCSIHSSNYWLQARIIISGPQSTAYLSCSLYPVIKYNCNKVNLYYAWSIHNEEFCFASPEKT